MSNDGGPCSISVVDFSGVQISTEKGTCWMNSFFHFVRWSEVPIASVASD
jgi:hypothetical protein